MHLFGFLNSFALENTLILATQDRGINASIQEAVCQGSGNISQHKKISFNITLLTEEKQWH